MAYGAYSAQAKTRSLDLLGASLVGRQLFANSIVHGRAASPGEQARPLLG